MVLGSVARAADDEAVVSKVSSIFMVGTVAFAGSAFWGDAYNQHTLKPGRGGGKE